MTRTGSATKGAPRRRRSPRARRDELVAYVCLAPWLIGFVGLVARPLLASLYYSFTAYPLLKGPTWAGLLNYRTLIDDPLFWKSLRVTTIFVLVVVPGMIAIGYGIALLLNQRVRAVPLWRTVYFVPSIVPAIAAAFLWSTLLNGRSGYVNAGLGKIGIDGPAWFASETWVLPAFMMMTLWTAGGGMILYLAALQQVDKSLYDAARIDGANAWQRLIHVTLPMTSPVILFTVITGVIGTFQIFTQGYLITGGGPNNGSLFYIVFLYRNAWQSFQMGYASAVAWVLVLILMVLTLLILAVARRFVYYESGGRQR
jgi:multiple sugar transport system permease protein